MLHGSREGLKVSLREKVKQAHHASPDVIIGKNGITQGVIEEIKRRLKAKGVIKVKMLRTALEGRGLDRREAAKLVAQLAGARLMGIRGRTFILAARQQPREGVALNSQGYPQWRLGRADRGWSRR